MPRARLAGGKRFHVIGGREYREHIAAMFAIGILLLITVGLAILYYASSTIINIRACFLK
jgi:hypothetical protein